MTPAITTLTNMDTKQSPKHVRYNESWLCILGMCGPKGYGFQAILVWKY